MRLAQQRITDPRPSLTRFPGEKRDTDLDFVGLQAAQTRRDLGDLRPPARCLLDSLRRSDDVRKQGHRRASRPARPRSSSGAELARLPGWQSRQHLGNAAKIDRLDQMMIEPCFPRTANI